MRRILFVACLLCLAFVPAVSGQDWNEFKSSQDGFVVNFPGDPAVTEIRWVSEYGADVPARVYTAKRGGSTYSVTVVDYNLVKSALIEKAKSCREGCPAADSYSGEGHWKDDVRGAMVYAQFKMLQRPNQKLTFFTWNFLGAGIESNNLQFISTADQSRTFANLYMRFNKLYILEATSPANAFLPNIFTESINIGGGHEGIYVNRARLDPFERTIITRTNPGHVPGGAPWKTYTSVGDSFTIDFPGDPVASDIPWRSEYGVYLPAYSYTAKNGASTYSVTVVNYNWSKFLNIARVEERCPPGLNSERCTGDTSWSGVGYWKNDVRGAMMYAQWKYLQRDATVAGFKWNYLPQGIESNELELVNADKSRTFVVTVMHLNRLYVLEATVPAGQPRPAAFFGSVSILNQEGVRAFHEGVYFNGTRIDPNEINARLTGLPLGQQQSPPPASYGGNTPRP